MDAHRRAAHADHVDGNALAGVLQRTFAGEVTEMLAVCGACNAVGRIAETLVEIDDVAAIVRCRSCTHTLLTILLGEEPPRLTFSTLAELRGAPF